MFVRAGPFNFMSAVLTLEQKIKLLAEIELANAENFDFLAELLFSLIQSQVVEGKFAAGAAILDCEIDQEIARIRDGREHRAKLRSVFGLSDAVTFDFRMLKIK